MAHLNPVPGVQKPRDFYRIDRDSIMYAINARTKGGKRTRTLEQNTTMLKWWNLKLFNVAPWYCSDWTCELESDKELVNGVKVVNIFGRVREPISHYFVRSSCIGELNVRLLPFKPSYATKSRWNAKLNATETYEVRVKTSAQRLEVQCVYCDKWLPFSRLNQHLFATRASTTRSKSCMFRTYKPIAERKKGK